jgi:cation transporter-like permease
MQNCICHLRVIACSLDKLLLAVFTLRSCSAASALGARRSSGRHSYHYSRSADKEHRKAPLASRAIALVIAGYLIRVASEQ